MNSNDVPLQFEDLTSLGDFTDEIPDPFSKFFATAEIAGSRRGGFEQAERFFEETAVIDREHRAIYVGIAKAAEAAGTTHDPQRLEKRFSENAARTELSANGKWLYKFNQAGELISGNEIAE